MKYLALILTLCGSASQAFAQSPDPFAAPLEERTRYFADRFAAIGEVAIRFG